MTIRPVRPEDEPALVRFHETLSDRSVYMRYLQPMLLSLRVAHSRLARIAHGDYDREITLVAERAENQEIVGVARLSKLHGLNVARFTILISDCCQKSGIGSELLRRLIEVGRQEKLRTIEALVAPDNSAMLKMAERLGFHTLQAEDKQFVKVELDLA
jgi:acetyltransferase